MADAIAARENRAIRIGPVADCGTCGKLREPAANTGPAASERTPKARSGLIPTATKTDRWGPRHVEN
jgi:hypothetical protein